MKKETLRIALMLGLLLTTWAGLAQSSETTKSGLVITDYSYGPTEWMHGYVERRYTIENRAPIRHTVTLELPETSYSYGDGIESLSATVTLEAGAKALLSMPQPPLELRGSSVGVLVKGFKKENLLTTHPSFERYSSANAPSLLLSKSLSAEALKERLEAIDTVPRAAPAPPAASRKKTKPAELSGVSLPEGFMNLKPLRLEREPSAWSPNWLAYTSFDGCLLAADDYAKIPEDVRAGLRAYVAAGGQVTFLGMKQIPEDWTEQTSIKQTPVQFTSAVCETSFGFGKVQAVAGANLKEIATNQLVHIVNSWYARKAPLCDPERYRRYYHYSTSNDNQGVLSQIPVKSGMQVSATLFLLILLVFALITGPGLVIYVSRSNRRIWLLWLVPTLSMAFSIAILVFTFFSEGITPSIHCQAVTLLDQKRHQAATLGALGVYAPLSLSDGLQFDRGTEVTSVGQNTNERRCRIVWGQRQHFTSGWIIPRMPAFFQVRRSEPRSERLLVTEQPNGGVEVVNMLGVPIRRLQLCDSQEKMYKALDLQPGEKRTLTSSGQRGKSLPPAAESIRNSCLIRSEGWNIENEAKLLLSPNPKAGYAPIASSYVALLSGCPFIENPIGYSSFKGTFTGIVVGNY
jgi:hypothetical protein